MSNGHAKANDELSRHDECLLRAPKRPLSGIAPAAATDRLEPVGSCRVPAVTVKDPRRTYSSPAGLGRIRRELEDHTLRPV
jgi:hypothetical protein